MTLVDKLDLLADSKRFDVKNCGDNYFVVSFKDDGLYEPIEACINQDGKVEYYMVGIYNSGVDFININMNALRMLEKFVNLLKNDKDKQ